MNFARINSKCSILAGTFKLASINGLESYEFVRRFMSTKEFESRINFDDCFEWADDVVLYYNITHNYKPFQKGDTANPEIMWFIGYLYKYWMITRHEKAKEVYKQLPFKKAVNNYGFYHTQDWDYIINDAIQNYNKEFVA